MFQFYLKGKGIGGIINDDNFVKVSVYNSEVLDVYSFFCKDTGVPVQPVAYEFALGIQVIYDFICIALLGGGKNSDFIYF